MQPLTFEKLSEQIQTHPFAMEKLKEQIQIPFVTVDVEEAEAVDPDAAIDV